MDVVATSYNPWPDMPDLSKLTPEEKRIFFEYTLNNNYDGI